MDTQVRTRRWAPRLKKALLRRLYESDARGIVDEELLDEVGYTLLARCESILIVADAQDGRVHCPTCDQRGVTTIILRPDRREEPMVCPVCGWSETWFEYAGSFRRRQLSKGGAEDVFRRYVRDFPAATSPQRKMVVIDQLIHEFHRAIKGPYEGLPTRAVAVNLIDGKLTDVVAFLDELTYGAGSTEGLTDTWKRWHEDRAACLWDPEKRDHW